MRTCTFGLSLAAAGIALITPRETLALPPLQSQGVVAPGVQFAAQSDGESVHIIAERYIQIDAQGTVLADESDVGDGLQGPLDMYPALAVGPDGAVHVVTRNGGSGSGGTEVRYASRAPGGGWSPSVVVGAVVPRNYSVGVVAPSGGRVVVAASRHVEGSDSRIDLYAIEGGAAQLLGATPQGWLRPDGDYRLTSVDNAVVLASGSPWPNGPTYFAVAADADADVIAQWQGSVSEHLSGTMRRGGPSLNVDGDGTIHLGYGSDQAQHYARHSAAGAALGADIQVMDDLGTWHLGYGNGDVIGSPDGMLVVAVALQNLDGDQTSAGASIMLAESTDSGATFSAPVDTGLVTDGGEGRMRPRLLEVEGTLMLLYRDNAAGGIALASAPWFEEDQPGGSTGDEPETTGAPADDTSGEPGDDTATAGGGAADATGPGGDDTNTGDTDVDTNGTGAGPVLPGGARGGDDGCGCRTDAAPPTAALWMGLLGLLAFPRRRAA